MPSGSEQITFPQDKKAFHSLVKRLVKRYKLPNYEQAVAVVANRIQHLPVDQSSCTWEYLANCVLKNQANSVAREMALDINQKTYIEQLSNHLKSNPQDQQALDELSTLAKQGLKAAEDLLMEYGRVHASDAPAESLGQT